MDELQNNIRSWMESNGIDDVAEYVNKGRRLKDESTNSLKLTWIIEFRGTIDRLEKDGSTYCSYHDYDCELKLRGEEPPYDEVIDDIDRYTALIKKKFEETMNTEEFDEIGDNILKEFESFMDRKSRSAN